MHALLAQCRRWLSHAAQLWLLTVGFVCTKNSHLLAIWTVQLRSAGVKSVSQLTHSVVSSADPVLSRAAACAVLCFCSAQIHSLHNIYLQHEGPADNNLIGQQDQQQQQSAWVQEYAAAGAQQQQQRQQLLAGMSEGAAP